MNVLRRLRFGIVAAVIVAAAGTSASAFGQITFVPIGPAAPPASLGGYPLTPFALDPRPLFALVNTVPDPRSVGPVVTMTPAHDHRRIGSGWACWSHGYIGDAYWTGGALSSSYFMPANTKAFVLYAEPNPFAVFIITAVAHNGTPTVAFAQAVNGNCGAAGFGFFEATGVITRIDISSTTDYAVGQFLIGP